MQLQTLIRRLLAVCAVAVFLLAGCVQGADVGRHGPGHGYRDRGDSVFPLMRWLRDRVMETIFGRPEKSRTLKRYYGGAALPQLANDVVVRFNVSSSAEETALAAATDRLLLDVWAVTTDHVDVRLSKDRVRSLMTLLPKTLKPMVLIPDVAAAAWGTFPTRVGGQRRFPYEETLTRAAVTRKVDGVDNVFFQDYQPLSVITSWLRLLEAMFPAYVDMISIGKSYEGRDIPALRMGERPEGSTGRSARKTILITGGIHAREWISTSTVNYLIWSFTTSYGKDPLVTKLLKHFDVVFVPVLNPDGYEYTWETNRLWRKSRQDTGLYFCRGLDIDHAFGYEWGASQHRSDPCSESYGGGQPFEAIEAMELAAWAKNETKRGVEFLGLLDLHSYSQQILFPYSYSCDIDPPNREKLEELAAGLSKAIRLASGEYYGVASACEGAVAAEDGAPDVKPNVESVGGSAIDWFYHDLKAHFSFQVKLRDTGSYGFLLPPENIIPTGEEMFHAVKYFGDYLLGNNGIEKLGGYSDSFGVYAAPKADSERIDLKAA